MPNWKHKVRLGDIFYDDALEFEAKRDKIVARLRNHPASRDGENGEELTMLLEELSDTTDPEDFNAVWDAIYDLADSGHWLWIDLISRRGA